MSNKSNQSNQSNQSTQSTPDIKITRDYTRIDPLKVEGKDPNKAYRWCDETQMDRKKMEGWEPSRGESVKYQNPDGKTGEAKEYRGLILCEMDRKRAEQKKRFNLEKARRSAEAARERFIQTGRRMGIATIS